MKNLIHVTKFDNHFLALFLMPIINLLFMHYQILFTVSLESGCFKSSLFDNLLACLIDVTVILILFMLLTFGRLRISLVFSFILTLILSFCNVFYSRFFSLYLPITSIDQAGNLADTVVIGSMLAGFNLYDLYYPFATILYISIYKRSNRSNLNRYSTKTMMTLWICVLILVAISHSLYFFHPMTFNRHLRQTLCSSPVYNSLWPNWVVFHKGLFRTMFIDNISKTRKSSDLSKEQMDAIKQEYTDYSLRKTSRTAKESIENIIFIIVESYLSSSSDLFVDGKEITPFLNHLKKDSNVYYNGHVKPNVVVGESSDGQFIYMTGLLPLRSEITVSRAKKNTLPGLPKVLKKIRPDLSSQMIIPTTPTLWEQTAMAEAYGIEKLYSKLDYYKEVDNNSDLQDAEIFSYSSKKDSIISSPFFSMILTISMHHPYNVYVEHGFHIKDAKLPENYRNYLITCHYTDTQIGKYLNSLKENGLYDNSLIIIVADHDAHPKFLDMEGKVSPNLPLYIINGGFDTTKVWTGDCNQLDIYTTILDIMGIDSEWKGLGHTLLNIEYKNSLTDKTWELSDLIINGDYFNKE